MPNRIIRCHRLPCLTEFPEYKKAQHIGHSYATCPFSTQADDKRVRNMLRDLVLQYEVDGDRDRDTDLLSVYGDGSITVNGNDSWRVPAEEVDWELDHPNHGQYVVPDTDIDTLLTTILGFARHDHSTTTGNREDDNTYGATEYLKPSSFAGNVYMGTASHLGVWGFECYFNNCNYRQNNDGKRYFYS